MISDLDSVDIKQFQFPIAMIWEITNKCHSNCMYCSGNFPERQGNVEMSYEEKNQFVQECIDNKLFAINISGGEPFLSDDLIWIVDKLTQAEIQVMVVTSGLIHDDEKISSLVANPYVGLNVSLDSFNTEINDYHRGISNSVDRVKEFLRRISVERKYIALECVLTKKNYKDIENYIENVSEFPVSEVRFQPAVAMSQKMFGSQLYLNDKEIQLTKEKVEELAKRTKHTRVRFVDQSNTIMGGFKNVRNWGGILGPDGEITVNAYLPFEFGKISDYGGFKAAWDKGFAHAIFVLFSRSDVVKFGTRLLLAVILLMNAVEMYAVLMYEFLNIGMLLAILAGLIVIHWFLPSMINRYFFAIIESNQKKSKVYKLETDSYNLEQALFYKEMKMYFFGREKHVDISEDSCILWSVLIRFTNVLKLVA